MHVGPVGTAASTATHSINAHARPHAREQPHRDTRTQSQPHVSHEQSQAYVRTHKLTVTLADCRPASGDSTAPRSQVDLLGSSSKSSGGVRGDRRGRGRSWGAVPIAYTAQHRVIHTAYSTAQHSTAQHSTAQHSTAQHSTAQHTVKHTAYSTALTMAFSG